MAGTGLAISAPWTQKDGFASRDGSPTRSSARGENISASEVEAVLEAHPSVRNAVAVPVADPQLGERVAAIVVTTAPFDLEACREWFAFRGITRFKTPELVIAIDSIPTLAAGKPDRDRLRKMAERIARGAEG